MTLTFTQEGDKMVAEFEVSSNFNLHIEKGFGALVTKQNTTADGEYDVVRGLSMKHEDTVLDCDAEALVYPKRMRIETYAKKVKASVTFAE